MSAVLNAGMPPAATDSRSAADSRPAFAANRAWELDRALMLEKSERRGWMVGGVGVVLAILGVLAVFAQGPLRQVPGWDIAIAPAAHASGALAGWLCALACGVGARPAR